VLLIPVYININIGWKKCGSVEVRKSRGGEMRVVEQCYVFARFLTLLHGRVHYGRGRCQQEHA
jgi:hypothetical protein